MTFTNEAPNTTSPLIDFKPLTAHPSPAELHNYRQWARTAEFRFPNAWWPRVRSVFVLLGAILLVLLIVILGLSLVLVVAPSFAEIPLRVSVGAGSIALTGLFVYLVVRALPGRITLRNPWPRRWRMSVFAATNGFLFVPQSGKPPIPSSVFGPSRTSIATDRIIAATGRYFEIGNYRREMGDSVVTTTAQWGYVAIDLNRELPHIVLKARTGKYRWGNRGIPGAFMRDQVLRLEGDFNKYFSLHVPRGYERDALYIFTPDLMALLIDEVAALEVELIDNWMIIYSPVTFDLSSRRTLRRLFRIVRLVGNKAVRQTARYNDDRTGGFETNSVAAPGRRLRQGVTIGSAIAAGVWILFQILKMYNLLHGF